MRRDLSKMARGPAAELGAGRDGPPGLDDATDEPDGRPLPVPVLRMDVILGSGGGSDRLAGKRELRTRLKGWRMKEKGRSDRDPRKSRWTVGPCSAAPGGGGSLLEKIPCEKPSTRCGFSISSRSAARRFFRLWQTPAGRSIVRPNHQLPRSSIPLSYIVLRCDLSRCVTGIILGLCSVDRRS